MAVSSDDWPRFSLLSGGGEAYACPQTQGIEEGLLLQLANGLSVECWLQIRTRKGSIEDHAVVHGCWLLHTPSWACGITSNRDIVVYFDGKWLASVHDKERKLCAHKWHHVAVAGDLTTSEFTAVIDGESVMLTEGRVDAERLRLPVSPTAGFRIGWAPVADSLCQLVLHDMRFWSTQLPTSTIQRWMGMNISDEHPFASKLAAHWSFSSGSALPEELDLSGNDAHLVVEKATSGTWLRISPLHLHPEMTRIEPARLVTWQDTESGDSHDQRQCKFVLEIQIQPPPDDLSHDSSRLGSAVVVALVLNFQCFRSPSLTASGKGSGIIVSLQGFVRKLPVNSVLIIYGAASTTHGAFQAMLPPTIMTEDGKAHACKALESVTIKTLCRVPELAGAMGACIHDVIQQRSTASVTRHRVISAILVNEDANGNSVDAARAMESAVEAIQDSNHTIEVHTLHLATLTSPPSTSESTVALLPTASCLGVNYVSCGRDLEWVLACVVHRVQNLVLMAGELILETVGPATFRLTNESHPLFHRYIETLDRKRLVIRIGACAYGDKMQIVGIANHTATGQDLLENPALVAVAFSYLCGDGRRCVARVSIRFADDLVNHIHFERAARNKRLCISDDDAKLLAQRRQLMKKKAVFISTLVAQEVAEAENMFKKVNIMKEELWARRKWIAERGLRLFEEQELECLLAEANAAKTQFTERMESLQARFVANARDSASRGASRGGSSNQETILLRVRLERDPKHSRGSVSLGSEETEEDTEMQQLQKVSVKLSVQTKALDEHLGKMEDLFTSVRLAETKGPVIMNDTRRSWMVRYQDMMNVKRDVLQLVLTKERIEQQLEFQADRVAPRQEVDAEVQSTNAAIARYDKEWSKRRKRVALCMKEIVGSVVDEFEASERIEAAKRDLAKGRLLKTLALSTEMLQSCVYVCFPIDFSQQEVITETPACAFTNLVHGVCAGLRHFCDATSESPICRRVSLGKCFLWWGVEQQLLLAPDDSTLRASLDARCDIRAKAWAVVVFSYNSMFSSTLAMADVKETLPAALNQDKPVFHVQLEQPFQSLDEFKQHWVSRRIQPPNAKPVPVEREFLVWRQNYAAFQMMLGSLHQVATTRLSGIPFGGCEHSNDASSSMDPSSSVFPCLVCLWPQVCSSRISKPSPQDQDTDQVDVSDHKSSAWFIDFVCRMGSWLDECKSAALQTAPRSYHIDPNATSPLSRAWIDHLHREVALAASKWEETRSRRTKEIQRQVGKLFKVYEEETHDLVALKFKFYKRRAEVVIALQDQLHVLRDEQKLQETWLAKLTQEDTQTEQGKHIHEMEQMVAQELWQYLQQAEVATEQLEELDAREDTPSEQELTCKQVLEVALKQSSRTILDVGRTHIEDRFRSMMRDFKRIECMNKIQLAKDKCDEQQSLLTRMTSVFDEAERITRELLRQRESFIAEDAAAFFYSSSMEIRSRPSATTQEMDLDQLRKLASDMDFHTSLHASVLWQALEAQLAWSTAVAYRSKVGEASMFFLSVYSPSVVATTTESPASVTSLKDYCQFSAEDPVKTWTSLLAMGEYIDKEALNDRDWQRLVGQWKVRFMDSLLGLHIQRWWTICQQQLQNSRTQLNCVTREKEDAFCARSASERDFQAAVIERERSNHQLNLLQRRLVETKQQQHFLLKLLHIARQRYEKASSEMNAKLQNVKTDVIYKSWSSVSDYHVGLVGELFDWRSKCAQDLDTLAKQITECQQNLARSDDMVQSKRLGWLKQSIADHLICEQAERLGSLTHRRLELILSLEKQRVFQQFRVLDPRGLYLTTATLSAWHELYIKSQANTGSSGGAAVPSRSGVDDALVQLSIARLDVIKQTKWRDTLQRKLAVLEKILDQQVEMRRILEREVETYRALGHRLTRRVLFLREKYETSGGSEYLHLDTGDEQSSHQSLSSFDRTATVHTVRASREQLREFVTSAQQDFLMAEATTCELAWRMQQHIASEYRAQRAIDQAKRQLEDVERYLEVLVRKDQELYAVGLRSESTGSIEAEENSTDAFETATMGLEITAGLAVFEFYARDQWFRTCLGQTTALGEKIKTLRELLTSLMAIKTPSTTSHDPENDDKRVNASDATASTDDTDSGDDQVTVVEQELRVAELALLLNRYESRIAEKTSETVKEEIVSSLMGHTEWAHGSDVNAESDLNCVLPVAIFHARLFSVELCVAERGYLLAQLRDFATRFDARDVAGNLSEVIYGASLDLNDLTPIFQLQSKTHVEEQWGVVLIALFFARLFRRASLRKVALDRRTEASALTRDKLLRIHHRQSVAKSILQLDTDAINSIPVMISSEKPSDWIRMLVESVRMDVEECGDRQLLGRFALGVLMNKPLHRALAVMASETTSPIRKVADELEETRAIAERRPPKPTRLDVFLKDRYTIKIQWSPIAMDRDLVYIAEISEHYPNETPSTPSALQPRRLRRFWHQALTTEKTSHTFYNLLPGHWYWVRVRSGFTRTKLGEPCLPLLVTTLE